MKKEHLIRYLKTIVELEKLKYEQNAILRRLNDQCTVYKNPKESPTYNTNIAKPQFKEMIDNKYLAICITVASLLTFTIKYIYGLVKWGTEHKFNFPLIKALGFTVVAGVIGFLFSLILTYKFVYKDKVQQYEERIKDLKEKNERIKLNNSNLKELYSYKLRIISNEYNIILKESKETSDVLTQYYNLNVLYPKYRNLVCVSSILEYFLSGVCDQLTGHEGAYNKLDQELLLKSIIGKLDDVLANLEEIKNNQIVLYNAINECNNNIKNTSNNIINAVKRIESTNNENSKKIENQLKKLEYIQSVSQANTQYLADMKHYEIWLR